MSPLAGLSLHSRFRDIDRTFHRSRTPARRAHPLAHEQLLERHADDRIAGLRWAPRKRDLRAFARDAGIDERTVRSFLSPQAHTLDAIEGELWRGYAEPAEPPYWMVAFVERCGLDPSDLLFRALIELDNIVNERERKVCDALPAGHWPSRPVTRAAFKKARQRARADAL